MSLLRLCLEILGRGKVPHGVEAQREPGRVADLADSMHRVREGVQE